MTRICRGMKTKGFQTLVHNKAVRVISYSPLHVHMLQSLVTISPAYISDFLTHSSSQISRDF